MKQSQLSNKDVVVIYMNLRGEKDKLGFPLRDPIPSRILTEFPATEKEYRIICYAFFTALFDTLEGYFNTPHATQGSKGSITSWVCRMCDMSDPPRSTVRADFFNKLSQKYTKVRTSSFGA